MYWLTNTIQQLLMRGKALTDELLNAALILLDAGFLIMTGVVTNHTGFLFVFR